MSQQVVLIIGAISGLLVAIAALWKPVAKSIAKRRASGQSTKQAELTSLSPQSAGNRAEFTNSPQFTNAPQVNIHFNGTMTPSMSNAAAVSPSSNRVHVAPDTPASGAPEAAPSTANSSLSKQAKPKTDDDLRRENAKSLLAAVSEIVAIAHELADQYQKNSKSPSQYADRISALQAIYRALGLKKDNYQNLNFIKCCRDLDSAITKLGLKFEGIDPRDSIFSYLDPFASFSETRTLSGMIQTFIAQAEVISRSLEALGFEVKREKEWRKTYNRYTLGRYNPASLTESSPASSDEIHSLE